MSRTAITLAPVVTTTPAPYTRHNFSNRVDAVTVWNGSEYVTVNSPVQAFFPASGGLTIQGRYGSDTTVKTSDSSACITAIYYNDLSVDANAEGIEFVS